MPVRIPTFADVGFNDPRAVSPAPDYPQTDPAATALGTFGQGVQQAGNAVIALGKEQEEKRQNLNEATANTDFASRFIDLHTKLATLTDPNEIASLKQQMTGLPQVSAQAIDDPYRQKLWTAKKTDTVIQGQADADKRLVTLQRENAWAGIERGLDNLTRNASASPDPQAFDVGLAAIDQQMRAAEQGGINPQLVYQREKAAQRQLLAGTVDNLITAGKPDQATALLDKHPDLIDQTTAYTLRNRAAVKGAGIAGAAVANDALHQAIGGTPASSDSAPEPSVGGAIPQRIAQVAQAQNVDPTTALATAQIESSMGQNLGSRGNIFQLGKPEWAASGGGQMGDPDTDIRNGVSFLGQKKQELAAALGRDPQPWEIYLAHQQGTGGAVALLSNPDKPASAVVPAQNIASNGGNPNAPASAFTSQWRDKFNQAAANVGQVAPVAVPAAPGNIVAFGDSIAAHLVRKAGAGGQESGQVGVYNPGDTAVSGYNPSDVLKVITNTPDDAVSGKNVVLSTGTSNDPQDQWKGSIPAQIALLKSKGAASVTVMGVGTKYADRNTELAQIAQQNGAAFSGPLQKPAGDGIHSNDPSAELAAVQKVIPTAAAPDQLVGQPAQAQPPQGQTPPVAPPPGMADLANQETILFQQRARAISAIENDPRSKADINILNEALRRVDVEFSKKQMLLNAQKQAITETRNAAADGYVQRMMKGPIDPSIVQQIAADPSLDETSRENLWRVYDAHAKGTTDGDTAKYGPKFFDYYQRLTLPDNDPNKIRDPSQLLALAVPKPDGSQDLTTAGVDKLRQELAGVQRSPDQATFSKRLSEFFTGVRGQIDRSGIMQGMPNDFRGQEQFYEYQSAVRNKVDQYLQQGKDPSDLIDPKKPDYMGTPESLKPYKRTMQQALQDWQSDMNVSDTANKTFGTPAVESDIDKAGSLADLQAVVKKNPALRQQAIGIAMQHGWIRADAPPVAQPQAPLEH